MNTLSTSDPTRPVVFIVGQPRSGTTFVAESMSKYFNIVIGHETHFYAKFYKDCHRLSTADDRQRMSRKLGIYLEEIGYSESPVCLDWNTPTELLTMHLMANAPQGYAIGEKTPNHAERLGIIFDELPSAKIVFVMRDPRDVVRSLRKVPWDGSTITQSSMRWILHSRWARVAKSRYPSRVAIVRFEDVVADTQATFEKVRDCLNLSSVWDVKLSDDGSPLAPLGGTFNVSDEPWKANALKPPQLNRCQAWMDSPALDTETIGALTRPWLKQWGYRTGAERSLWHARHHFRESLKELRDAVVRAGDALDTNPARATWEVTRSLTM